MTDEECKTALEKGTWLVFDRHADDDDRLVNNCLVKVVRESPHGYQACGDWSVVSEHGHILVLPSELRIATPQDFLELGDD